jgi:two-component system chemotaxis response regulator CheY
MTETLENLRVLIVDDNLTARQVISLSMRDKNIASIDTAANGKKARDMIDSAHILGKPYHIVFLDWEMPVMPGIEVLSFFRSQPQFANTAFIMVTAVSVQAQVLEAIKKEATTYMIKPSHKRPLIKNLMKLLLGLDSVMPFELIQTLLTHIQKFIVTCGNQSLFIEI